MNAAILFFAAIGAAVVAIVAGAVVFVVVGLLLWLLRQERYATLVRAKDRALYGRCPYTPPPI